MNYLILSLEIPSLPTVTEPLCVYTCVGRVWARAYLSLETYD